MIKAVKNDTTESAEVVILLRPSGQRKVYGLATSKRFTHHPFRQSAHRLDC